MPRKKGAKDSTPRVRRTNEQIERDKNPVQYHEKQLQKAKQQQQQQQQQSPPSGSTAATWEADDGQLQQQQQQQPPPFGLTVATWEADEPKEDYDVIASPPPRKRPKLRVDQHHNDASPSQQQQEDGNNAKRDTTRKMDNIGDDKECNKQDDPDRRKKYPNTSKAMTCLLDAIQKQLSREMNRQRAVTTVKNVNMGSEEQREEGKKNKKQKPQPQQQQLERWLIPCLMSNNFWISRHMAKFICHKLGIVYEKPGYYKDIKLWLPEVQWGSQFQPFCVQCGKSSSTRSSKIGNDGLERCRLVIGLDMNYYIMTRRWKCHICNFRFHSADPKCRAHLPRAKSLEFPAFLTHRAAVDEKVLSLIQRMCSSSASRPATAATAAADGNTSNNNFRQVASLLKEFHMKEYERLRLLDAYEERQHVLRDPSYLPIPFSSFEDPDGYAGRLPSAPHIKQLAMTSKGSAADSEDEQKGVAGVQQQLIMYNEQLQHEPGVQQQHGEVDEDEDDNDDNNNNNQKVSDADHDRDREAEENDYGMEGDDGCLLASIIDRQNEKEDDDTASNRRDTGATNAPAPVVPGAAEEEQGQQDELKAQTMARVVLAAAASMARGEVNTGETSVTAGCALLPTCRPVPVQKDVTSAAATSNTAAVVDTGTANAVAADTSLKPAPQDTIGYAPPPVVPGQSPGRIAPPAVGTHPLLPTLPRVAATTQRARFAIPFPMAPMVPGLLQEAPYQPPIHVGQLGRGQRGKDNKKRRARECKVCGRADCRGAKTRVKQGESRECDFSKQLQHESGVRKHGDNDNNNGNNQGHGGAILPRQRTVLNQNNATTAASHTATGNVVVAKTSLKPSPQDMAPPPPAVPGYSPGRVAPPPASGMQPVLPILPRVLPANLMAFFAIPVPTAPGGLLQETPYQPPIGQRGKRGKDNTKRKARQCKVCSRTDCRGAKPRVKQGESKECEYRNTI